MPELGAEDLGALERLAELASRGPRAALEWSPIEELEAMTTGDEIAYAPLRFGYAGYSDPAAARPCSFTPPPREGAASGGSVLGGAGIAISAFSDQPEAAAFAGFATSASAQHDLVAAVGGQPGRPEAWRHPRLAEGGFGAAVLATIETAYARPRSAWSPASHDCGGHIIRDGLASRRPSPEILAGRIDLYRSRREAYAA